MRVLTFLSLLILIAACNSNSSEVGKMSTGINCNADYDSLLLKQAINFEPNEINLNKTLPTRLDSFLLHTDSTCLRQQRQYQFFIAAILAKLYYYHLVVGHQSYDLQSMEQGGAKVIIEEFKKIAGYNSQRFEMLSSSVIVKFIENDEKLKTDTLLATV